jgi:WD40 repeat protein
MWGDLEKANPECPVSGHNDPVRFVCFSPCGKKIVSGGGQEKKFGGNGDFSIRIWDAKTGAQIGSPLTGHSRYVTAVSYSCFFSNVWCVLTIEDFTAMY